MVFFFIILGISVAPGRRGSNCSSRGSVPDFLTSNKINTFGHILILRSVCVLGGGGGGGGVTKHTLYGNILLYSSINLSSFGSILFNIVISRCVILFSRYVIPFLYNI